MISWTLSKQERMPQKPSVPEDNPSAFKHFINKALLVRMSTALQSVKSDFPVKTFLKIEADLTNLELKNRVQKVSATLKELLPPDYLKALQTLVRSLDKGNLSGFDLWPYTEFVQTYGKENFKESMAALYIITQKFTGEFAVRPFIEKDPEASYKLLKKWAQDKNTHVRRLATEGSRPRLPWGLRLKAAVADPSAGLEILDLLKFDSELYVRKSVANHLNDIAKDHPDVVIQRLKKWAKEAISTEDEKNLAWIQRQALRSLIKNGYKPALKLMGSAHGAEVQIKNLQLNKKIFKPHDSIEISFDLISKSKKSQKLIVDYIVHYVKSNKATAPKVFKLKTLTLDSQAKLSLRKKHSLKPVTTRKLYPGAHLLEIQVNGQVMAKAPWTLKIGSA